MLMKQGISSFSRNLVFVTRIELQIVFSTKANLLFLLYLMVLSCQIKQICLMKSFLGILDLMIRQRCTFFSSYIPKLQPDMYKICYVYMVSPDSPDPGLEEKVNVIFYFHCSLWNLKRMLWRSCSIYNSIYNCDNEKLQLFLGKMVLSKKYMSEFIGKTL